MSYYGEVTLERAFLSLASDPSQKVECGTAGSVGGGGSRTDDVSQQGSFRNYADGTTRLVLGAAVERVETLVLRCETRADAKQVVAWAGRTMLFRDTYGRRIFGAYLEPVLTDVPLSKTGRVDVALTFVEVDYTEGV